MVLMTLWLLFTCVGIAHAEPGLSLEQARDQVVSYYVNNKTTLDSWEEVVGLAQAGVNLAEETWQLPDWQVGSLGPSSNAVDYAKVILGMLAAGQNPCDISSRNLVDELAARQLENGSFGEGLHNTTWSMVALDTAGANYDVAAAIDYLVNNQTAGGGFAFSGDTADPDMTGFVLLALAPHTGIAGVSNTINQAQDCLKNLQLDTGGFGSGGLENTESIAAVIRGLVACQVDITTVEWQKNGHTMIDALFSFQLENKSFCHIASGNSNAMSTRQALIAIADMVGRGINYTLSSVAPPGSDPTGENTVRVRVEGASQSLADEEVTISGTALEALVAAVGAENVDAPGGFINSIQGESGQNGVAENTNTGWNYYVIRNGEIDAGAFNEGAGSYNLQNGDQVVFYIGAYNTATWANKTYLPVVSVNPAAPTAGQSVTLSLSAQKYTWGVGLEELSFEESSAIGDYTVVVGDQTYTSQFGQVTIPAVAQCTLSYIITNASEAGYPDVVTYKGNITVGEAINSQVRVRVEGASQNLADEEVTISGTAMDALVAAVGAENVNAPGGFVNSIRGESGQNGVAENTNTGWNYYVIRNGEIDAGAFNEGAGSYNLQNGDQVVFYIGAYDTATWANKTYLPVVSVSPVTPTAGQDVTLSLSAQKYTWGVGLQELSAEEASAIGDYTVVLGDQPYTSQSGQVTIPAAAQGTVSYRVTNASEAGYPDVVAYSGGFTVAAVNLGGGVSPQGINVNIAVVGKNNNLIFGPGSVTLSSSDQYGKTAMGALAKTGLDFEFSSEWYGLITAIAGEGNEGMNGWCFNVNGTMPSVLAIDQAVAEGDRIIYWYSTNAMSSGPSWNDLTSGKLGSPQPITDQAHQKVIEAAQATLSNYNSELTGLGEISKLLNADQKMTPAQAAARKQELAANTVSISQEAGVKETMLVDANSEVSLLVPESALTQNRTITVKELTASDPPRLSGIRLSSSVYEFGPSGTKFDRPVTISIKVAINEEINVENLTPAWYDEQKQAWIPIPAVIDLKEGLVIFQIDHFTRFAVVEIAKSAVVQLPQEPEKRVSFADVGENIAWAKEAIEILAGKGIVKGTGQGFEPQRPVTRAEFVAMVVNALNLKVDKYPDELFRDVNASQWFAGVIGCAYRNNIIGGYPDGSFRPQQEISRNEIAAVFYRLQGFPADETDSPVQIKDIENTPAWALNAVKHAVKQQLIRGYVDQTFGGNKSATRAETAVIIHRYLQKMKATEITA